MNHTLLHTSSALADALRSLQGPVALDTEFHAERRYRPSLMLVQFCDSKGPVFVVDAKEVRNLTPIADTLQAHPLIAHSLHQDLAALDTRTQVHPLVSCDPQILAGLLGYGYPRRLEELLEEVLQVVSPPSNTMSDWSARPLNQAQLEYASADAAHLHDLWNTLAEKAGPEKVGWAQELSKEASLELRTGTPDDDSWKTLPGAKALTHARSREALRQLLAWRESEARKSNQAPRQLFSDHIAIDLARRRPTTAADIAIHRLMPKRVVRDLAPPLLACIARAESTPVADLPAPARLNIAQQSVAASLESWALKIEATQGIAARLLLPRTVIEPLVRAWSRGECPELPGDWRESQFGEPVRAVLETCEPLREACAGPH
ncbi:MAG: HRDC domain-containing protein [Myxococcota bacterium]|nr:HRDC domain-containing protein [Myxococcota bacterium]